MATFNYINMKENNEFNDKIQRIVDLYYESVEAYNKSSSTTDDYYNGVSHAFRIALLHLGVKKLSEWR